MVKISTSILGIKNTLKENILKVIDSKTDYIHIDIMDGRFVPNETPEFNNLDILLDCNKELDIHLMVYNLADAIDKYAKLKPKFITIHYENENVEEAINLIKSHNIKVGMAIKPNTKVKDIYKFLDRIDLVLIMSVEPGYGGQEFMSSSVKKIKKIKKYINKNNYNVVVSVDGGINDKTAKLVKGAGCDILVSGSYITSSSNYDEKIDTLLR